MRFYEIIKVNRYFKYGAEVTHEKTLKFGATIDEVLEIAKKQKADIEEMQEELEEFGCTCIKGYMISDCTCLM